MSELKSCPFCGGGAEITEAPDWVYYGGAYMVVCTTCRAQSPDSRTIPEAIAAWNRRPEVEDE
jgi:Lar family restriction alleviation protein